MEKAKLFQVAMTPESYREIKSMAGAEGVRIGRLIEIMTEFTICRLQRRQADMVHHGVSLNLTPLALALADEDTFKGLLDQARKEMHGAKTCGAGVGEVCFAGVRCSLR